MQKIKRVLPVVLGLALLVVPSVALAQFGNFEPGAENVPMAGETDIAEIIVNIIRWIMGIVGLISVIMIIYGGVTYATAAGVEERNETGKKILLWAIVGLVIAIVAFTLARTIVDLFISE